MKLLLTNDDGIDAPGLAALQEAAHGFGDLAIVAPAAAHSGCSHRVTTDDWLRIEPRDKSRFAVHGTPADCVRLGLFRVVGQVDWVLAGINAGGNLGADVWHSGTVAAVREAVLHGRCGIAFSQYRRRDMEVDWQRSTECVRVLLQDLLARPCPAGSFWNVNLPQLEPGAPDPEIVFCPLDSRPLPVSFHESKEGLRYNGIYHQRDRVPGADVDVCFRGQISVTQISLF
jgi:5'-nucleotidase